MLQRAYSTIQSDEASISEVRNAVLELSDAVAVSAAMEGLAGDVAIVVALRGGMLMFPSFYRLFGEAHFGFLAFEAAPSGKNCIYSALPEPRTYDGIAVLDTVASSGETIMAARDAAIRSGLLTNRWLACVVTCTSEATATLSTRGWHVIGYSTEEDSIDGIVVPDLGSRDAGELVVGSKTRMDFPAGRFFSEKAIAGDGASVRQRLIYDPVIDIVSKRGPSRLLDVGCGDGSLTHLLAAHAREVIAIDTSEEAINLARDRSSCPNVIYDCCSVDELRIPNVECVVCSMVLNVVDQCDAFIQSVTSLCAKGSLQVWALLHPAFQYNFSQWQAKKNLTATCNTISYCVEPSYFDSGTFQKTVGDATVIERHRSISFYLNLFIECGLTIERVLEPRLPPDAYGYNYADSVYPKVLIVSTRKES